MREKKSDFYFLGRDRERGGNDEDQVKYKIGLVNN